MLVPTMGALHAGHAALIRHAASLGGRVVVSIFVNPLQFGPREDYSRYPRNVERDRQVAEESGATDIFYPTADVLTPVTMKMKIDPGPLALHLCGRSRPGHFTGVCTIVAKLFNIIQPDVAVFGWKDAQQFIILRTMVRDLNFPVEMVAVDTIREPDGLAMSSRNSYLATEERAQAPHLYQALKLASEAAKAGASVEETITLARQHLETNTNAAIDYVEIVALTDLQPLQKIEPRNTLLAAAANFATTRLIDNIRF